MSTAPAASTDLARRLARFRAASAAPGGPGGPLPHRPLGSAALAERLATTLGGEVVTTTGGRFVRIDGSTTDIPLDRERLAGLPGHPPADRPLVCLDTETTGLATAAGTVAFCIGLGWWEGAAFRQVQLLLPDHADEAALLGELSRHLPPDAWLVTYNGRGFDWPLLVARYRLARHAPPTHDGHLDLLPIVRRVFRHRMADARLRTVEHELLGLDRHDDVDGWEIPERYLGFLRGGPPQALAAVVRHNHEDVRSMARLIALLDTAYATPEARRTVPPGDLAGLARAFLRARRTEDALSCLDEAMTRRGEVVAATARSEEPWWSPRVRPDFGGTPPSRTTMWPSPRRAAFAATWDDQRIAVDRAHLLRRTGRHVAAEAAWSELAAGPGRTSVIAWIEVAKLREHRLMDPRGALEAATRGLSAADRRRAIGMPEPALEVDLRRRIARLRRRVASGGRRLEHDLVRLGRDDESADPLADGPGADRKQVRNAGQTHALHGQ